MSNKEVLKQQIRELSSKGQYLEAIPPMERYCDIIKDENGSTSDRYVTVINDLGGMYRNVGDFKNAEETFNKALDIIKTKLGDKCIQYATTTVNLACMYRFTKEFDKAEKLFLSAIEIYDEDSDMQLLQNPKNCKFTPENMIAEREFKKKAIEKSTLYANVCNNIGVMYQDMQDFDKAVSYHNKSLEMLQNTENFEYLAITLNNFVNPYLQVGNFDDAEKVVKESLKILEERVSKIHPFYSTALNNLGTIYFKKKDFVKALECFEESEQHLKNSFGVNSPQYHSCIKNIEVVKSYLNQENK